MDGRISLPMETDAAGSGGHLWSCVKGGIGSIGGLRYATGPAAKLNVKIGTLLYAKALSCNDVTRLYQCFLALTVYCAREQRGPVADDRIGGERVRCRHLPNAAYMLESP